MALAALLVAVTALIARSLPVSNVVLLAFAVGSPYVPVVALAGLVLAALGRRKLLSLTAVAVLAATLAVQLPWYHFADAASTGDHTSIRLLSSNLGKGQADTSSFVELATYSADVLTVAELTPEARERFSQAGLDEVFPHSVLMPKPGAAGIGLWSRYPFGTLWRKPRNSVTLAARLRVPALRFEPIVASTHIISPVASGFAFDDWRKEVANVNAVLDNFAQTAGPAAVIVGGDFNSTPDIRQFRDLLTDGYRDAVDQTGAGFAPTFPANGMLPPLITIDHVLTRHATVASIQTVTLPGSDHRSLLATVNVPRDPTVPEANS